MHDQALSFDVSAAFALAETTYLISRGGSSGEEAFTIIASHSRSVFDADLCAIVTTGAERTVIRAVSLRTGTVLPFPLVVDPQSLADGEQQDDYQREIRRVTDILRTSLQDSGWFIVAAAPFPLLSGSGILLCANRMERDKKLSFPESVNAPMILGTFASLAALAARVGERIRPRQEVIDALLADLLSPSRVDESHAVQEDLLWRAWMVGIDLRQSHVVCLLGIVGIAQEAAEPAMSHHPLFEGNRVAYFQRVLEEVQQACQKQIPGLFTIDEHLRLLCLVQPPQSEQHFRSILESISKDVAHRHSIRLFIGVSDPLHEVSEYRTAYQQAVDTYEMGRKLYPDASILHHSDLGIMRYIDPSLFRDLPDDPNIDIIRHIESYDHKHTTSLLPTLEAYILSGGNLQGTATLLAATPHAHVTTIKKRMGRLKDEEVSGSHAFDVANTPRRWPELLAALQVYRLQKLSE